MGSTLVGRDGELARVEAWLAERFRGAGAPVLLVAGEAGVGKTALLRAADTGSAAVLRASAEPFRALPFGLLGQVVTLALPTDADAVRAHLLADAAVRPVVVVLDDLHWSDDATLDLLVPLAQRLATDPVAILCAYRSDDLPRSHRLRAIRATLRQQRHCVELPLGPLPAAGVAQLIEQVTAIAPDPALVEAVLARTEGVPFFVEELAAARVAASRGGVGEHELPLPETVRDAVLLRAAGLAARARATLDVAAVIGLRFTVPDVVAVGGEQWPDELDDSGLIVSVAGDQRRFRHALAHEAVYAEVPWSRRRALHRSVAERATDPGVAANHWLAASDGERARSALLAAAANHELVHAYRDAARFLTTALEHWPATAGEPERLSIVDRLARCCELCGDSTRAVRSLRELVAAPDTIGPEAARRRAGAYRRLAVQHELLGHWPSALTAREAAAAAYAEFGQVGEAATERLALAAHLRSAASFRAALEVLDDAQADASAARRTDLICRVDGLRGNVLSRMGRAEQGLPVVRQALDRALQHGLSAASAEIYQRLADSLEHAGDYRGASRAYDRAFEFCAQHGHDATGQLCLACATVILFHSGRWERAVALAADVLADEATGPHARAVTTGVRGLVHAMRGEAAHARSALLESRGIATRIDLVAMEILSSWGMALVDEWSGRPERAAETYRHVVRRCEQTEERHYCVPVLQFAAARFAIDGASTDLGATTALLADAAARTGSPEARAGFAYAAGESALVVAGPGEAEAVGQLSRAAELLVGLDLPIVEVLVHHRLGVALSGSDDGRASLRTAYTTAQRLRARALLDRMRADLDDAPGRVDAGLTERELQIMSLVGEGLTSRAVAARLYLSVRTVEMHVRNAVAKLGCRTRAEAIRQLAEAGALTGQTVHRRP
ncbi:MAG TPA: AAA family ATPase [Micromonosporaceae bacterium]